MENFINERRHLNGAFEGKDYFKENSVKDSFYSEKRERKRKNLIEKKIQKLIRFSIIGALPVLLAIMSFYFFSFFGSLEHPLISTIDILSRTATAGLQSSLFLFIVYALNSFSKENN